MDSIIFNISSFFFFLSLCLSVHTTKMITKQQWNTLQYYIQNKQTITQSMNDKIQYILYSRHLPLVKSTTYKFRKFHKFKTKMIKADDLESYGSMGLIHAIRNYNGKALFHHYAKIYIKGGLYQGLTKHYPITKVSAKERRMRKDVKPYDYETCGEQYNDKYISPTNSYLGKSDYLSFNEDPTSYNTYRDYWIKISQMPPLVKRIMFLKFDNEFNIVMSNHLISIYCGCSEETIRKNVKNAIMNITDNNIDG